MNSCDEYYVLIVGGLIVLLLLNIILSRILKHLGNSTLLPSKDSIWDKQKCLLQ